jgi:hypothetical protein
MPLTDEAPESIEPAIKDGTLELDAGETPVLVWLED